MTTTTQIDTESSVEVGPEASVGTTVTFDLSPPKGRKRLTTFPDSPRLLKGGIVLTDPNTSAVRRIIALQYTPDTLTRTMRTSSVLGGLIQ